MTSSKFENRSRMKLPDTSNHKLYPIKLLEPQLSWGKLRREPATRWFDWSFAPMPKYDERFARQYRFGPPSGFPLTSSFSGIVHHLSGPYATAHANEKLTFRTPFLCVNAVELLLSLRIVVFNYNTCSHVGLLGPCYKTGLLIKLTWTKASTVAISGTFNSFFKVLFNFPSRYLFAIGLSQVFSLGWNLPPLHVVISYNTNLLVQTRML